MNWGSADRHPLWSPCSLAA